MTDLSITFASLVKNNNGMFKTAKQGAFLLSQCVEGAYIVPGNFYGNGYDNTYFCDEKGIHTVKKHTNSKGYVTVWERVEQGKTSVQELKEFKRLTRLLKEREKAIASRQATWDSGKYAADFSTIEYATQVFNENQNFDKEMLELLNAKLSTL